MGHRPRQCWIPPPCIGGNGSFSHVLDEGFAVAALARPPGPARADASQPKPTPHQAIAVPPGYCDHGFGAWVARCRNPGCGGMQCVACGGGVDTGEVGSHPCGCTSPAARQRRLPHSFISLSDQVDLLDARREAREAERKHRRSAEARAPPRSVAIPGWKPVASLAEQHVRFNDRVAEALAAKASKQPKRPYVWPLATKGKSVDQMKRQALGSIERVANSRLLEETMRATRDCDLNKLGSVELQAEASEGGVCSQVDHTPHSTKGRRVLDENGAPVAWPWGEHLAPPSSVTQAPCVSSRRVRARHSLDDLVELGLDHASADRNRGRNHPGVRAWFAFCEDVMGVPAERPMDPHSTPLWEKLEDEWLAMRFAAALVRDRGITPTSAAQYFSAVQGWHAREHGVKLCGGLKLERLPAMLKGLRRVVGEAPRAVRRGVAPKALRDAMDLLLDPRDPVHANMRAALAVALQGLLRSAEYTSPDGRVVKDRTPMRSDLVELTDERMVLMISPCKNMRQLSGKTSPLVIGAGGLYLDAVAEVYNLRRVDPVQSGCEAFTPMFRDPATNKPISYSTLQRWIKDLMVSVGENPDHFSTHSARIGGATALFAAGADETVIRTMGRWSSDIDSSTLRPRMLRTMQGVDEEGWVGAGYRRGSHLRRRRWRARGR